LLETGKALGQVGPWHGGDSLAACFASRIRRLATRNARKLIHHS
jgi:hypothetical protein